MKILMYFWENTCHLYRGKKRRVCQYWVIFKLHLVHFADGFVPQISMPKIKYGLILSENLEFLKYFLPYCLSHFPKYLTKFMITDSKSREKARIDHVWLNFRSKLKLLWTNLLLIKVLFLFPCWQCQLSLNHYSGYASHTNFIMDSYFCSNFCSLVKRYIPKRVN